MRLAVVLPSLIALAMPALAKPPPPKARAVRGAPILPITSNEYGANPRAPKAIEVGAVAPDFTLLAADESRVTLSEIAKRGEVVLVFYRGHW